MSLEDRVRALEVGCRRWRFCALFLLVVLGVGGTLAASLPQETKVVDLIRTREIEVLNKSNRVAIRIAGEYLSKRPRIMLVATTPGGDSHCVITPLKVSTSTWIGRSPGHIGDIADYYSEMNSKQVKAVHRAKTGTIRSVLAANCVVGYRYRKGEPLEGTTYFITEGKLGLYHSTGDRQINMDVTTELPFLAVHNATGKKVGELRTDAKGNGELELWDKAGKSRVITAK